jgi:hypothetical protein
MLEIDLELPQIPQVLRANGGLRALTPDEENILYTWGELVLAYIVDRWPVRTGTSQDAFSMSVLADPQTGYGVKIENSTDYAEYIRAPGASAGNFLWVSLFQAAWDTYKGQAMSELTAAIEATHRATISYQTQQAPNRPGGRGRGTRRNQAAQTGLQTAFQNTVTRLLNGLGV